MQRGISPILGLVQLQEEGENPRFPGSVVWEAGVDMVQDGRTQTRAGGEARRRGGAAHERQGWLCEPFRSQPARFEDGGLGRADITRR